MKKYTPKIISLYVAVSSLFLSFQTLAADDISTAPRSFGRIYTDTNTLKRLLDNGLTVVVHETHKVPIATIDLMVKTGSANETGFSGSGISHLVEHMLFKDEKAGDGESRTEKIRSFGGHINGFTSRDYTCYAVTVPSEYTGEVLKVLYEIISAPSFDAIELKKEKDVILDEMKRNRDDDARHAFELSWALVFKEHPYKYPIIGYEELLEKISKEEIEGYYSTHYSPHNMILTVSGGVKKDQLINEIESIFGQMKRRFLPPAFTINEPPQLAQRQRVEYRPISLAHGVLAFRSASINEPILYPLDVIAIALGRGENSILTRVLRDEKRLVYHISCQNYTLRDSGFFYIYFSADPSKINETTAAVMQELEKIKEEGIKNEDMEKSKRIAEAEVLELLETAEGRAQDITVSEALADNYEFTQFYLSRLLAVSEEETMLAANYAFKKENLNTVLMLPEAQKKTAEEAEVAQKLNRIVTKELLPNGIRVLVCEDHSTPLCAISALFLGGVRAEDSQDNGISNLVSKLLLDGTANRSEQELKSAIESEGGSIGNISGNNSLGITINLLSDNWQNGIEIMSDALMNSEFNGEKIEKERNLAFAAIKQRDDDIVRRGLLLFKQNFFGEHPYRFDPLGTKDTLLSLDREEILDFYGSLCLPSNMVLAVIGDIDKKEVFPELEKRLGLFPKKEPKLPSPPLPELLKNKKEISLTMKREQSLVMVGFPSVRLADNDRYIFEVADSIMSGSDGRMYKNIRDKLGVSYALGSSFMPGLDTGCHIFYAMTTSKNIELIKDAILKEINELRHTAVGDDELEAAKRCLITSHTDGLQRNSAFGLKISLDELYGLGYDNFKKYSENINSVTASQIKRVANQYFNMENCLIVTVHGEKGKE